MKTDQGVVLIVFEAKDAVLASIVRSELENAGFKTILESAQDLALNYPGGEYVKAIAFFPGKLKPEEVVRFVTTKQIMSSGKIPVVIGADSIKIEAIRRGEPLEHVKFHDCSKNKYFFATVALVLKGL